MLLRRSGGRVRGDARLRGRSRVRGSSLEGLLLALGIAFAVTGSIELGR
jgi:hypothetical protein